MKVTRYFFFCVFLASSLFLTPAACAQSEVHAELLMRELISSVEGKQVTVFRTELPPGYKAPGHRHPGETFVYILSGRVINQLEDEEPRVYKAGEFFFEPAGALHARFENDDPVNPAAYIVFGIRPAGEE